jgi:hypothetical protein
MASGWQSSLLIKNVNCLNQKDQQGKRKYLRIAFESTSQRNSTFGQLFLPAPPNQFLRFLAGINRLGFHHGEPGLLKGISRCSLLHLMEFLATSGAVLHMF